MASLTIMSGGMQGEQREIDRDRFTIGRAPDNALAIDDGSVSSKHCIIIKDNGRFTIRDTGSTNGTLLNDSAVTERLLRSGDVITVGAIEMRITGDDVTAEDTAVEGPRGTVKIGARPQVTGQSFAARRDRRWVWRVAIALVSLLAAVALVLFLTRLF